jgi:hypothetical protein
VSNATPMDPGRRFLAYWRMNGNSWLTPKQLRRVERKRNHATAPFGKKAE